MHLAPLFFREQKALKNKMQKIKNEKESNIGVKSNKTNGDYHDVADTDADGYYEDAGYGYYEDGEDYGDDYKSCNF